LLDQLERWERSRRLGDYLAAVAQKIDDIEDEEVRASADSWLEWAFAYTKRLDPLAGPLTMPADPEPSPEALQPFLHGWNPYGPH